jgi:large subunit ribosomal protein L24
MKIRKGDTVTMLAGKDSGKKGVVERTIPARLRVVVSGLNIVKRHKKPRKQGEKGQIIDVPSSVDISNVALVCPSCSKVSRVGYLLDEATGKKNRFCKKCNATL